MSVLKSELKILITHEVGVRVDDALEGAKREMSLIEGRQAAFNDGAKAVEALQGSVDKDIEEGQYDLAEAARIKRYITRASLALTNMGQQASLLRTMQMGKISGFDTILKLLKNMMDVEKSRVAQVQEQAKAMAQAPLPSAPTPFPAEREAPRSLKEMRLAEQMVEETASAATAEVVSDATPPIELTPASSVEPIPEEVVNESPLASVEVAPENSVAAEVEDGPRRKRRLEKRA